MSNKDRRCGARLVRRAAWSRPRGNGTGPHRRLRSRRVQIFGRALTPPPNGSRWGARQCANSADPGWRFSLATLGVGGSDLLLPDFFAENAILCQKVVDHVLLPPVQPAGRGQDNEPERVGHRANLPDTAAARKGLFLKALEVAADFFHHTRKSF